MDIRTYWPILVIGCFLSIQLPSFSQVSDVKKSVEDSYEDYQSVYEKISNPKSYGERFHKYIFDYQCECY